MEPETEEQRQSVDRRLSFRVYSRGRFGQETYCLASLNQVTVEQETSC